MYRYWEVRFALPFYTFQTVICFHTYKQLVADVRKHKGHMTQIFNWTREKTEAYLVLEGSWLEKQVIFIDDFILIRSDL